jgi:hypothetical protein
MFAQDNLVTAEIAGVPLVLRFPSAVAPITDASSFEAAPEVYASVAVEGGSAVVTFVTAQPPNSVRMKIGEGAVDLRGPDTGSVSQKSGSTWFEVEGAEVSAEDDGTLILVLTEGMATVAMRIGASAFAMMSGDGVIVVPPDSRIPEWSIALFDDADFKRPRPLRLGVPVASTVPVNGPGITAPEKETLLRGIGTERRTLYFRVVSSTPIPSDVAPRLVVRLPNGLDTVGPAQAVEMLRRDDWSSDDQTVYTSKFDFEKEDAVRTVDGFAYLSVDIPLRVTRAIALDFEIADDPVGDPWLFGSTDQPSLF